MDNVVNQKFIVTGGAGFIGSHLVDLLLENGNQVVALDNLINGSRANIEHHFNNSNFQFLEIDIKNKIENQNFENVNGIFHLAGIGDVIPSINNPEIYMKNNLEGSFNVLQAAEHYSIPRIIYAASSSCYGNAETPTNEEAPIACAHPYAVSKFLAEQLLFKLGEIYRIKVSSACIFNAYGRRFKTTGAYGSVIGVFLKQRLENYPLTIAGNGSQSRDFVHVKDVARAFNEIQLKGKPGNRYNVGSGSTVSIQSLASIIGGQVQYIPDRGGEARNTLADISKIQKEIGWRPQISFEEGCLDMLSNIKDWHDAPFWTMEKIAQEVSKWNDFFEDEKYGV
jgi:UDP-glucose 4-epimerase